MTTARCQDTKYRSLSELIFDLVDVRGTWCLFSAHPLSVSGQASPWNKDNKYPTKALKLIEENE